MKRIPTLLMSVALAFTLPAFADHDDGHEGKSCKRHGPAQHLKEADANKDGAIDKAEFQAMHDKHFTEMDTDKDGKLTKDEMKAAHKARKDKMKEKHEKHDHD